VLLRGIVEISGEAGEVGCAMGEMVEGVEIDSGEAIMVEVRGWWTWRLCTGGEG